MSYSYIFVDAVNRTINYMGCYHKFFVSSSFNFRNSSMTNELCVDICANNNYSYAATKNGDECYCDNSFGSGAGGGGSKPIQTDSNCDTACSGNSTTMCGSQRSNSVFETRISKYLDFIKY